MQERRLRSDRIPRHVAVIMDGNGRWAERRGLPRTEGHNAAVESVRELVRAAHELGVSVLTLYAFSTENWSRPKAEVDELMRLCSVYIERELDEIARNAIRVRAIGRLDLLPPSLAKQIQEAAERTREHRDMQLVFALSYGGRREIVDAARELAREIELGALSAEQIDEKVFASHLYAPDLPDPDLLVRTGAEMRISNFLLWQLAYSEIHVTDVLFPDFRKGHLVDAIRDYQSRERRFGLTGAQLRGSGPAGS